MSVTNGLLSALAKAGVNLKGLSVTIAGEKFAPKAEVSIMDDIISAHSAQIKA